MGRTYIAVDLKSFYASVECVERGLNPLTTNLVVADNSRSSKTICLAVSPSLKKYGLSGRSRLFEVESKAREIKRITGKSLEYIIAVPRMSLYIEYSSRIYEIYLKYFSPEDIHVYSIDEVFIDVTSYLVLYKISAYKLAQLITNSIFEKTMITATVGIAPNLYLSKIAMDIEAKHISPDKNGCCIAELNDLLFRKKFWNHKPLTDFWRIGKGIEKKLNKNGLFTLGDIARCSLISESFLYKIFGKDAEILIDHAWGYEPCSIKDIKSYKSKQKGMGSGQVLHSPYTYEKAEIIVREMTDSLIIELVRKNYLTNSITLIVGYDVEFSEFYTGDTIVDFYGRTLPKPAHGTIKLNCYTSLMSKILPSVLELYKQIVNKDLLIRRINLQANNIVNTISEELFLFDDIEKIKKEKKLQQAFIQIKDKYGKNSLLKGTNLLKESTMKQRNMQIGGHKA